jgi:hypothetical protein
VLEDLINKQIAIQAGDKKYSVAYSERGIYGRSDFDNRLARTMRLASEVLWENKAPIQYNVLKSRIIERGGDKDFLNNDYDLVLRAMQDSGDVTLQGDKIALKPAISTAPETHKAPNQ